MEDAPNGSCPACRHVNPFGSAFCNACGRRLDERGSSPTPSRKEPRPLFRTPLVPDEVRNALGPLPWPMPPKQPDTSETGPGVFADTGRSISHPPEVGTSSRHLADESPSKKVTIPTLELERPTPREPPVGACESPARFQITKSEQSSLPQAMRYTKRGNDSRQKTVAKALSVAALIALVVIGGAMVADRAQHASVQTDDQSAARLSVGGDSTKAGGAASAPPDRARDIRSLGSAISEPSGDKSSGEATANFGVPQSKLSDEERRNSVGGVAAEHLDQSMGLALPRSSIAAPPDSTSLTQSTVLRSSGTGDRPENAATATQQSRRFRPRPDDSPSQEPKECPMQLRVLGLCPSGRNP
jgi:hypothetical protein